MNRKFGVELELVGISMTTATNALNLAGVPAINAGYTHQTMASWKVVSDGSLRDESPYLGTCEVVSPVLQGEDGIEQIRKACAALQSAGAKVNQTCGLHVHIDGAGMQPSQVLNILARYSKYESQIDGFMPSDRRANNYCRTLRGIPERISQNLDVVGMAYRMGSRYFKVNLESWARHGTVEFRQHGGTVESTKIIAWVKFLQSFVQASMECQTVQAGESTARSNRGGTREILRNIFHTVGVRASKDEILARFAQVGVTRPWSSIIGAMAVMKSEAKAWSRGRVVIEKRGGAYERVPSVSLTVASQPDSLFALVPSDVVAFLQTRTQHFAARYGQNQIGVAA